MHNSTVKPFQTTEKLDTLLANTVDVQAPLVASNNHIVGSTGVVRGGCYPVEAEVVSSLTRLHAGMRCEGQVEIRSAIKMRLGLMREGWVGAGSDVGHVRVERAPTVPASRGALWEGVGMLIVLLHLETQGSSNAVGRGGRGRRRSHVGALSCPPVVKTARGILV